MTLQLWTMVNILGLKESVNCRNPGETENQIANATMGVDAASPSASGGAFGLERKRCSAEAVSDKANQAPTSPAVNFAYLFITDSFYSVTAEITSLKVLR